MKNLFYTIILISDFVFAQKINCTISKYYNDSAFGSFNLFETDSNSISILRFNEEKGERCKYPQKPDNLKVEKKALI
ncbi:MAG TPA: hypothetical protein PKN75_13485, partial [Bacteroidia bacterium]|nr:hypothetical protein [Bacteroidia bacterium]HNU34595.1 hypothetical protein [Bacteroidia bacterium]